MVVALLVTMGLLAIAVLALACIVVSIKMLRLGVRAELIAVAEVVGTSKDNWNGTASGHQTLAALECSGLVLTVDPETGKGVFVKHRRPSDEAFGRLIGL